MLTEQDILKIIKNNIYRVSDQIYGLDVAAESIHNQHLAECERLMEIAFNAARETKFDGFFKNNYQTFQDFKDSLKTS